MKTRITRWALLLGMLAAWGCEAEEENAAFSTPAPEEDISETPSDDAEGEASDATEESGDASVEESDAAGEESAEGGEEDTSQEDAVEEEVDTWVDPAELWGPEVTVVDLDETGAATSTENSKMAQRI